MLYRFWNSIRHAFRGLRFVWKEELNFRIQTCIAICLCLFMIGFAFSAMEAVIIILTILLVLGAEIFNTLLENALDVVQPDHHVSVGKMKDMMAGVVLLLSVGAVVIGGLVVVQHFLQ